MKKGKEKLTIPQKQNRTTTNKTTTTNKYKQTKTNKQTNNLKERKNKTKKHLCETFLTLEKNILGLLLLQPVYTTNIPFFSIQI